MVQVRSWFLGAVLVLSLLGLADSAYLAIEHYRGVAPTCVVFNECNVVTTSKYATVFGIPIALFGVFYYLSVFVLAAVYSRGGSRVILKSVVFITGAGLAASALLFYLQLFVIKALCLYCVISAAITTLLFVLSGYFLQRKAGS